MQAVYPDLADLANIQCENCHGPGSQHAYSLGDTNKISKTLASGDCNQCHDAPTHHIKAAEWYNSRHAVAVEETECELRALSHGPGLRELCGRSPGGGHTLRGDHLHCLPRAARVPPTRISFGPRRR